MDGFSKQVLARLPLADGTLSLLSWILKPEFLDDVFEKQRGPSYEQELTFPVMVSLIQSALLEHNGSAHQAMKRTDDLTVSFQAAYAKLRRIPVCLSVGFFAHATDRLGKSFPKAPASRCRRVCGPSMWSPSMAKKLSGRRND